MALTADDVLNQKFTITKFRDGYDLDQVDDFLDRVVEDFRTFEGQKDALVNEINELKEALQGSQDELQAAKTALQQAEQELQDCQAGLQHGYDVQQQESPSESPSEQTTAAEQESAVPVAASEGVSPDAVKSSAMLQLALELHDKYINEGETRKAELIASGEKAVKELLEEGKKKRAVEIATLNEQKTKLQDAVEDLRAFESEYRTTLRSYIEAQLRNLEGEISGSINS